jgi:hypothetical protein
VFFSKRNTSRFQMPRPDQSRWMADHPAIQTEDHARAGKVLVDRAKGSLDEMEAERDGLVRPLNVEVKAINDRYRPARTSLEKLADELKKRLSTYARALEIERVRKAEEARKAAEEAERAAREAEQREREAVEDADQGICDIDLGAATQEADAAFAAFRKEDHVAARAERDSHIRIAGGFGKAMGLRGNRSRRAGRARKCCPGCRFQHLPRDLCERRQAHVRVRQPLGADQGGRGQERQGSAVERDAALVLAVGSHLRRCRHVPRQ